MRPQYKSQTGTGSTTPIVVDHLQPDFKIGFGVVVTGTVNYTVQHSFDDPESTAGLTDWFDHADVAAQSADKDGNYAYPVRAVRLTVNSGSGTADLTLLQGV